jgi:sulfite reductase (ferredoxin)
MGGRCDSEGARFGAPIGRVPAKAIPGFIAEIARDFQNNRADAQSFASYFDSMDRERFVQILDRHEPVPKYEERPDFYSDFGSDKPFSLAGRGAGECGSGIFELIQSDLAAAAKAIEPFDILLPTCRSLLITRGIDSGDPDSVFRNFEEHFINTALIGEEFRPLLLRARSYIQGWKEALDTLGNEPAQLLESVKELFSTLDANLEFHPPRENASEAERTHKNDATLDLRGVKCPLNFAKAKLKLESLRIGDALQLLLDDGAPIQNVPASFRSAGQKVESITDTGAGYWKVMICKTK